MGWGPSQRTVTGALVIAPSAGVRITGHSVRSSVLLKVRSVIITVVAVKRNTTAIRRMHVSRSTAASILPP